MERQTRRPGIADVARVAGVSVPTVSRVLNGTAKVSEKRRKVVLEAVKALGYHPNAAALALVTGRPSLVSVLTGDTVQYGYASTIQGIEEAARAAGRVAAITVVGSSSAQELRQAVDLALSQPVAGVIILEFDESGAQAIQRIPHSVPLAVVSSAPREDVPHVLFDDRRGGAEATRYLLGLGHRTVHHVSAPSTGHVSGRLLGWQDALAEAGVEVPEVVPADWGAASGYAAGRRLAQRDDVTAVFCGNDEIAFGVIRALQAGGRRVPEDISVVGFDDHPLAPLWTPALTTISQDFVQLGRSAVELLLRAPFPAGSADAQESPGVRTGEGPVPHLVIRDSSAALAR